MRGWKARIGLIVPSSNCNVEPSFYMVVPEGVSVHSARIPTPNTTSTPIFLRRGTSSS